MTLLIDEIHKFYSDAENIAAFEEWKERKRKYDDSTIKSKIQKTHES